MRAYPITHALFLLGIVTASRSQAQIRVNPTGLNVSTQNATTVFLSYGGLRNDQVAAEAVWCARLVPAAPDIGFRCDPSSLCEF